MSRTALLAPAILLTLAACSGIAGPTVTACSGVTGPPWPATVAGCWAQYGVDTYAEFALVQQGTTNIGPFGMPPRLSAVNGTFSLCGAVGGCDTHYEVTGTVVFPLVVLRWTEWGEFRGQMQRYDMTFDGIVTADTLAGRVSFNGQPPGPTGFFLRRARP